MTDYLIDTNIISELSRGHPDKGITMWASSISHCFISVVTVEEIFYGLSWKPNTRVREWVEEFIDNYTDVLPVTAGIACRAGQLRGRFQARGITRTQADLFIAATAAEHNLTLVTRNVRDFTECGIEVLNPFE